jgi:hypothetical protein
VGEAGSNSGSEGRFQVLNGIALFGIASRFNHACVSVRNTKYVFDNKRNVLTLTICKDTVPAGSELFVSYGGDTKQIFRTFGFRCNCGGCRPLTDEDIRDIGAQEFGDNLLMY